MKTEVDQNGKFKPTFLHNAQRVFGVPKPVKGFRRFGPERIGKIGLNPDLIDKNFLKKELIKPLDRPRVRINTEIEPMESTKWSVGCTKKCNHSEFLPKLDIYKDYYFLKPSETDVDGYKNNFLSTDHVAIRVPEINKVYGENSFLKRKAKFGPSSESKDSWSPRIYEKSSAINKSNVDYDIINFKINEKYYENTCDLLDKNYYKKKKGINELAELMSPTKPKFNANFRSLVDNDESIFKKYKGVFTDLYDSSWKNGNIYVPFRPDKEKRNKSHINRRYEEYY